MLFRKKCKDLELDGNEDTQEEMLKKSCTTTVSRELMSTSSFKEHRILA